MATLPVPAAAAPASTKKKGKQPSENELRAREAYERGRILFQAEEYEDAIGAFEEAAALFASPDFQFNLALCHERLKNYDAAIRHYKAYLATESATVDTTQTEARIAALQDLAQREKERKQEEAEAEKKRIEEEARREAQAQAEAERAQTPPPAEPTDANPGRSKIIAGASLLGVGVGVGAGGGLGFGLAVNQNNADLEQAQDAASSNPLTFAEAQAIEREGKRLQRLELITIGVGGAVALGGAVLLTLGLVEKRKSDRVSLTPYGGAGQAGLMLRGEF